VRARIIDLEEDGKETPFVFDSNKMAEELHGTTNV